MDFDERQDPDNIYVTIRADEFYRAFGVRATVGEWDVPVEWFRAEFGVNPETEQEYDPLPVFVALGDLWPVQTADDAIALTPPLPDPEAHDNQSKSATGGEYPT